MIIVDRLVREENESGREKSESLPQLLSTFRESPAWVLLGEPGAGKSTSLKQEAEECGEDHQCLSISEFLYEYKDEDLKGKTLFLDGLDEIRASSNDETILFQLKAILRRLGNPKFRLSCRAADWLGTSDSDDIKSASQNSKIIRLSLCPLDKDDILSILSNNYEIESPQAFIDKSEQLSVSGLLENPQMLEMLVKAVDGKKWPESRSETFQLACEKLVEESNRRHRNRNRTNAASREQLIDVAGQLFATMLLADKDGIALDQVVATKRFPYIDDYLPLERDVAYEVVRRNLFRFEREECFKPTHRSISEYLASIWLSNQIDNNGLPLVRVLNLLIGRDGRAVSGLRGLYGWLAIHCKTARTRLIHTDAITVVAYGDAKPLSETDKRCILSGLKEEAEELTVFHRLISPATPFGALSDTALLSDYSAALSTTSRTHATQSYLECLLTILQEGEPIHQLADLVLAVVRDETWWGSVRITALNTWLCIEDSANRAERLLHDINKSLVSDSEDELTGILLRNLYPRHLTVEKLMRYLHPPKNDSLMGMYVWFWEHDFAEEGSNEHLPHALEYLISHPEIVGKNEKNFHLKRMIGRLVSRCVVANGDSVADETLCSWLRLGNNNYYDSNLEKGDRLLINEWLGKRPDRYKGLLRYFVESNDDDQNIHFYSFQRLIQGAGVPDDIGIWCLGQASNTDNESDVKVYLSGVTNTLIHQQGSCDLTLEIVEKWAEGNKTRQVWLNPYLVSNVGGWINERAETRNKRETKRDIQRGERTRQIEKHISLIEQGTANSQLMHQLAGVWLNHYSDIYGETLERRFIDFCENGCELLEAAKLGFIASPEHDDLPTISDIIGLSVKKREHFIRKPCLIGMELRWEKGLAYIDSLSDKILKHMVAFRLTYGCGTTPEWFIYLVRMRSELVADVFIQYVVASLRAKVSHIDSIYALENDQNYANLASLVVPTLLSRFPLRAKQDQLNYLEYLLKSALSYQMEELEQIVKLKLSRKSLASSQKVYWLAVGSLIGREVYENQLLEFVDNSLSKLYHLSGFLSSRHGDLDKQFDLSVNVIGVLIEKLIPHAELDWSKRGGTVTPSMRRGDHIRSLVCRLASLESSQAEDEIERLLKAPALEKLKFSLEDARNQIRHKRREAEFSFLPLNDVANVLTNKSPSNIADLTSLMLSHLDDIADEIQHDNDDGFSKFWNIDKHRHPTNKRVENACRDELLLRLRVKLNPFGIDCQPEGDYSNDKRADVRISYLNEFELPIEIKRDDHKLLWSAAESQLVQQYSSLPKASGYGVYLVLWFGKEDITKPKDGSERPQTPIELQNRLKAVHCADECSRIEVQVLDVSWPEN